MKWCAGSAWWDLFPSRRPLVVLSSQAACEKTIRKYGIGACGPRGFYGTIDVHLEEENEAAHFMGTKESIIYSLDFAAPSSVIPAFLKRGDIILCDEGCVQSIKVGCNLSRAKVQMFRHNDMKHLDELLQKSVAGVSVSCSSFFFLSPPPSVSLSHTRHARFPFCCGCALH